MSEPTREVTLEQLDQMLDTPVKIAELQAREYAARGNIELATSTLKAAIERKAEDRARILARAQQQAAQPAPAPAPQPTSPAQPENAAAPAPAVAAPPSGPLAGLGSPAPAQPPFRNAGDAMIAQMNARKAATTIVADPLDDPRVPFGLSRKK